MLNSVTREVETVSLHNKLALLVQLDIQISLNKRNVTDLPHTPLILSLSLYNTGTT